MKERKNIIIILLCVIIAILVTLVILLATNMINFNFITNNNTDKNLVEEDNASNNNISYSDYTEENDTYIYEYTFTNNENYVSEVPVEDTYAINIRADIGKNIYILRDKKLYYNIDDCYSNNTGDIYCNFNNYSLSNSSNSNDSLVLFDEFDNIKRIKAVNYGSGIDCSLLVITEDGKVYLLSNIDGQLVSNELKQDFAKYGVDDILEYEYGVPAGDVWKVILKDGTIMEKKFREK